MYKPPPDIIEATVNPDGMSLLRVNAPHWYSDEKFLEWLNSKGAATWHQPGQEINEYSDIFFVWDTPTEGSDYPVVEGHPGIPDWIISELAEELARIGEDPNRSFLVWVSNLCT